MMSLTLYGTTKMTPEEFISEAKRRGLPKEQVRAKFNELKAAGAFDQQKEKSKPVDFSVKEMAANIPGSAWQYVKDITTPIHSFPEFASGIKNLALGVGEKLIPGEQEHEKYVDTAGQFYKDRYGGFENIKQTVMTDPVGALADVSGIASLSTLPMKATKAGRIANKAAIAVDPYNLVKNTVKSGVKAVIPDNAPKSLYQSAAKFPPRTIKRGVREKITEAALKEQIMPTSKGIEKATSILSGLDSKIDDLIKAADDTGKTFSRKIIYQDLKELRKELSAGAGAPANLKKYKNIVKNLDELMEKGPDRLTPSDLQKFKVATYRDINWRAKPDAKTETMQTLARGARKGIENVTPEIKEINKRYGPLAELRNELPNVANRIDNHNMVSLNNLLGATVGGTVADFPGAVVGGLASLADHPKLKAGTALYLQKLLDAGLLDTYLQNYPGRYYSRQGLLQSGRLSDEMRE